MNDANYTMAAPTFIGVAAADGTFCMNDLKVTPKAGTTAPKIGKTGQSSGGITAGNFVVKFLKNDGTAEEQFTWVWYAEGTQDDYVTKTKWQIMDSETKKWRDCTVDELKFNVPAGKGMWVQGKGHTLNIPAPEL